MAIVPPIHRNEERKPNRIDHPRNLIQNRIWSHIGVLMVSKAPPSSYGSWGIYVNKQALAENQHHNLSKENQANSMGCGRRYDNAGDENRTFSLRYKSLLNWWLPKNELHVVVAGLVIGRGALPLSRRAYKLYQVGLHYKATRETHGGHHTHFAEKYPCQLVTPEILMAQGFP